MNIKMEDTGRKPQMLKNKEPMLKDKESRFVPFQGESQNPFAPEWKFGLIEQETKICLLYTSPSPRDQRGSRMPSSA